MARWSQWRPRVQGHGSPLLCAIETIQPSKCSAFPHSSLWVIFQISFCYNFSAFSETQLFLKRKLTLTQMEKSSNPLQNSSTLSLFLALILCTRDTIPTLNESADLELLDLSVFKKNIERFWKNHNFSWRRFSPSSDFIMGVYCVS